MTQKQTKKLVSVLKDYNLTNKQIINILFRTQISTKSVDYLLPIKDEEGAE